MPHGRAVTIPLSERRRGHGSHTMAARWEEELIRLRGWTGETLTAE